MFVQSRCLSWRDGIGRVSAFTSLLASVFITASCSDMQVKTSSDADWVSEHSLYEGDDKKLFVNSEFGKDEKAEPPTKAELLAKGDAAWRSGDTEKSLFEYLKALKLDENDPIIYYKIGAVHESKGNARLAELAYARCLELDPNYVPALERQGTLLLKQRKYAKAKRTFARAIALDQGRVAALKLSEPGQKEGKGTVPEYSIDPLLVLTAEDIVFGQCDEASPYSAYNGLGVIFDLEGDHEKAMDAYETALEIIPGTAFILNNMGYSQYLAGNLPAADRLFRRAIGVDEDYIAAWRNLALVHVRRGQYQEAIDILVSRVSEESSAYNTVGYLCMLDNKFDLAERYFNQAIELSPVYFKAANDNLLRNSQLRKKANYSLSMNEK